MTGPVSAVPGLGRPPTGSKAHRRRSRPARRSGRRRPGSHRRRPPQVLPPDSVAVRRRPRGPWVVADVAAPGGADVLMARRSRIGLPAGRRSQGPAGRGRAPASRRSEDNVRPHRLGSWAAARRRASPRSRGPRRSHRIGRSGGAHPATGTDGHRDQHDREADARHGAGHTRVSSSGAAWGGRRRTAPRHPGRRATSG